MARAICFLDSGATRAPISSRPADYCGTLAWHSPHLHRVHAVNRAPELCDLLASVAPLSLIDSVAPLQLALRLLILSGSWMLEFDEVRALVQEPTE